MGRNSWYEDHRRATERRLKSNREFNATNFNVKPIAKSPDLEDAKRKIRALLPLDSRCTVEQARELNRLYDEGCING